MASSVSPLEPVEDIENPKGIKGIQINAGESSLPSVEDAKIDVPPSNDGRFRRRCCLAGGALAVIALVIGLGVGLSCRKKTNEEYSPARTTVHDGPPVEMVLTSDAYFDGHPIPSRYAATGKNLSPPLSWSNVPEGTESFVLIMEDPETLIAPKAKAMREPFVHWVMYNIDKDVRNLDEGVNPGSKKFGVQGVNSWHMVGYDGPRVATGSGISHSYVFKIYALGYTIPSSVEQKDATASQLRHYLDESNILGEGKLTCVYS